PTRGSVIRRVTCPFRASTKLITFDVAAVSATVRPSGLNTSVMTGGYAPGVVTRIGAPTNRLSSTSQRRTTPSLDRPTASVRPSGLRLTNVASTGEAATS